MNGKTKIVTMGSLEIYKTIFRNSPYHFKDIAESCKTVRFDSSKSIGDCINSGADSVTIYIHGWMESYNSGQTKSDYIKKGLVEGGYKGEVLGYLWDSDEIWVESKKKADKVGSTIAEEIDMMNSDVEVNILSHSLGTNVAFELIKETDSKIENVFLMGGATKISDIPSSEDLSNINQIYNIYDRTDELLLFCYSPFETAFPIGMRPVRTRKDSITNIRWVTLHHSSYYLDEKIYDKLVDLISK